MWKKQISSMGTQDHNKEGVKVNMGSTCEADNKIKN